VVDFCSCGAKLPSDARFCHKCGKPVFEPTPEPTDESTLDAKPEPVAAPHATPHATTSPSAQSLPINLSNGVAVRSSLVAGLLAYLFSGPLGALGLLALVAGGALAVVLYRRSTGQALTVANGARIGWITGIFLFAFLLATFTAAIAFQPTFFDDLQKQFLSRATIPEADVREMMRILRTPFGMFAMVFGMFLSATLPPIIGGAVGAKFLRGRGAANQPHA
jgi:hypothetical protein